MRVLLNGRFATRPITGVHRFARGLANLNLGLAPDEVDVALPGLGVVPLASIDLAPDPDRDRRAVHWEQGRLPTLLGGRLLAGLCNSGPVLVRNQVIAIHDAAPEVIPQSFSVRHRLAYRLGIAAARRAARVVTVSESSKIDLVSHYDLKPDRIDVVPNGVDSRFTPGPGPDRPPYCLFVGAHDPRKNLAFLEALWPEVERRTGLGLVVTGRAGSAAHAAPATRGDMLDDVTDDELITLYRGAHLVLHPSSYEGFGLPLLEGMACGTPFLSADVGAAAELATQPDRQILPLDAEAWVEAIVRSAGEPQGDRAAWSAEAVARAADFTWQRSAQLLAGSLRRAASSL